MLIEKDDEKQVEEILEPQEHINTEQLRLQESDENNYKLI